MPTNSYANLPYRPCVGIMLFNQDGKVLVGQRIDFYQNAWQLPQGGIEEDEDPKTAALRELNEEIGQVDVEVLDEMSIWLKYDLPSDLLGRLWNGRFRGQKQKWFAFQFLGAESDINPLAVEKPEFRRCKWVKIDELPNFAVSFKKKIYERLVDEFSRFAHNEK